MTEDQMRDFFVKAGFVEGEDFEVSGYGNTATFSLTASIPYEPLPDVLLPFAPSGNEVERSIWKGYSGGKRTYNGARFHLALQEYVSHEFNRLDSVKALKSDINWKSSLENLKAYTEKRKVLWTEFVSRPGIVALKAELEKLP